MSVLRPIYLAESGNIGMSCFADSPRDMVAKCLVWYELHSTMENAIVREKQLKAGSRKKKLALIETTNPAWRDLYDELI
jgi:predicted GIY-YIG superfamily endonuclease